MKGTTYNIELAVVSSGQSARAWQQLLERELARTGNLSGSPMRADALVVIIDPSFPDLIWRTARRKDACSEAIREAPATGKMLLPVSVGNAVIPEDSLFPEGIRALTRFQGLALGRVPRLEPACSGAHQPASAGTAHFQWER